MRFFYHPSAGQHEIALEHEWFHSLVRVRRKKQGERVVLQNLEDQTPYTYSIEQIGKREAVLSLVESGEQKKVGNRGLQHLLWGVCDAKTVYSTLPMLFQMGVQKTSFVWCERSQNNVVLDFGKIEKILKSSAEQCGRNVMMEWEEMSFSEGMETYSNMLICDFGGRTFESSDSSQFSSFFIGPEGGFTEDERAMFEENNIRSFDTETILKSETACVAVASSFLYSK